MFIKRMCMEDAEKKLVFNHSETRGQGSMEYLFIIAGVLAVAAIAVLFLTSAGSGAAQQQLITNCVTSATTCQAAQLASPGTTCLSSCARSCSDPRTGIDLMSKDSVFDIQRNRPVACPPGSACSLCGLGKSDLVVTALAGNKQVAVLSPLVPESIGQNQRTAVSCNTRIRQVMYPLQGDRYLLYYTVEIQGRTPLVDFYVIENKPASFNGQCVGINPTQAYGSVLNFMSNYEQQEACVTELAGQNPQNPFAPILVSTAQANNPAGAMVNLDEANLEFTVLYFTPGFEQDLSDSTLGLVIGGR